jgi:ubiquinone/menaquinone biosynthesis C-methylase UbiE
MAEESAFLSRTRTWDQFYSEPRVAEFRRRIYLEAFGDEYPSDAATDGYITRKELRELADALEVGPGRRIADLGCGRGGPGQWIAGATSTQLIGVDFSAVAIEQARARAGALGLSCSYQSGTFDSTGLESTSLDGAFSIDVIWAIPDKPTGFAEIFRILKPGARFVFIDWERDLSPPGYPPPVSDHRPLVQAAGLEIVNHVYAPLADELRRKFYEKMIARQEELIGVTDPKTAESTLREARAWLGIIDGTDYLLHSKRVMVVSLKRGER